MADRAARVSPPVAAAFAVIGFFAVLVAGFGLTALAIETDVVPAGHGQLPGILGTALATLGVAGALWSGLNRSRVSYGVSITTTVAAVVGFLLGLVVGALLEGSGGPTAVSLAGTFALSWFALVLAAAAFVAGWVAVALVRTRARAPRWPWERDEEE